MVNGFCPENKVVKKLSKSGPLIFTKKLGAQKVDKKLIFFSHFCAVTPQQRGMTLGRLVGPGTATGSSKSSKSSKSDWAEALGRGAPRKEGAPLTEQ